MAKTYTHLNKNKKKKKWKRQLKMRKKSPGLFSSSDAQLRIAAHRMFFTALLSVNSWNLQDLFLND